MLKNPKILVKKAKYWSKLTKTNKLDISIEISYQLVLKFSPMIKINQNWPGVENLRQLELGLHKPIHPPAQVPTRQQDNTTKIIKNK